MLINGKKWLSKPVQGSSVNWGNPLSKGLLGCWIFNNPASGKAINLVDGYNTPTRSGTKYVSKKDYGLLCDTTIKGAFNTAPNKFKIPFPVTLVLKCNILGDPDASAEIFGISYTNSATNPFTAYFIQWDITNGFGFSGNSGGTFFNGFTNILTLRGENHLVVVFKESGINMYINGVSKYGDTTARTTPSYATANIVIGSDSWTNRNSNMIIEQALIFKRALSQNEVRNLYNFPYQIVNKPRRFIPRKLVQTNTQNSTATPALAISSLVVKAPSVLLNASQTVNPALATSSIVVFSPSVVLSQSNIATPALATETVLVNAPTVQINSSNIATPSVSTVTVLVNQPTVSSGGSQSSTVTPAVSTVTFQVNAPSVNITSSTIATPGVALTTIIINAPTVVNGSGAIATPALAVSNIIVNNPTTLVSASRLVQPSTATIQVMVFQPSTSSGISSNITIYILAKSKIDKTILSKSEIRNTIKEESRIEKYLTLKSEI